eukprot:9122206-Alexandrium_andersonii.AAC.1
MVLDESHSSVAAAVLRAMGTSWVVLDDLRRECRLRGWTSSRDILPTLRPAPCGPSGRLFPAAADGPFL